MLISSLQLIDKTSSAGNAKLSTLHFVQPSLQNLLDEPELLDGFRSEMSYRATRQADEQLCYDSERRLVTWAIDWCRQTAEIADVHHTNDKVRFVLVILSNEPINSRSPYFVLLVLHWSFWNLDVNLHLVLLIHKFPFVTTLFFLLIVYHHPHRFFVGKQFNR